MRRPLALAALLCVALALPAAAAELAARAAVYTATPLDIDGKPYPLAPLRGRVVLIVNTASLCGNTWQYGPLQELHARYHGRGLTIVAFPSDDFGGQEPGSAAEIKAFCVDRYAVGFPIMAKSQVRPGPMQSPVFTALTAGPQFSGPVTWNFAKFLLDRRGRLVGRFEPRQDPLHPDIVGAIERALAAAP
jgi:glutathione peroxidase